MPTPENEFRGQDFDMGKTGGRSIEIEIGGELQLPMLGSSCSSLAGFSHSIHPVAAIELQSPDRLAASAFRDFRLESLYVT